MTVAPTPTPAYAKECWMSAASHAWPLDCCFHSPGDLPGCFDDVWNRARCCPWKSVEDAQIALLRCDLSSRQESSYMVLRGFATCASHDHDSVERIVCMRAVMPLFQDVEDSRCHLGTLLMGSGGLLTCFINRYIGGDIEHGSGDTLYDPSISMANYRMCNVKVGCCARAFCKRPKRPSCSMAEMLTCTMCLLLVPVAIINGAGWGPLWSWTLELLQNESRLLYELPVRSWRQRLVVHAALGESGEQHAALVQLASHSGPFGQLVVSTVLDDFAMHQHLSDHPFQVWEEALESGIVDGLIKVFRNQQNTKRNYTIPDAWIRDIQAALPRPNRPETFKESSWSQAVRMSKLNVLPMERPSGLHDSAWRIALSSWNWNRSGCPMVNFGIRALLQQRARQSVWPAVVLALCIAFEVDDNTIFKYVLESLDCGAKFSCNLIGEGHRQHARTALAWSNPLAVQTWVPLVLMLLSELRNDTQADENAAARSLTASHHRRIMSFAETLSFLKSGGSLARIGDGELLTMASQITNPALRTQEQHELMRAVAQISLNGCQRFKAGLVDVHGPMEHFPGQEHHAWWQQSASYLGDLYDRYLQPGTYCNAFVNYAPASDDAHSLELWRTSWEDVFASKCVLVLGHPFAQAAFNGSGAAVFSSYAGDTDLQHAARLSHRILRHVALTNYGPFKKSHQVMTLRDGVLPLHNPSNWFMVRDIILSIVSLVQIDVVAIAWGVQSTFLVAELACRDIQAVDIGRLLWEFKAVECKHSGKDMCKTLKVLANSKLNQVRRVD